MNPLTRAYTVTELQTAKENVARMSMPEFRRAARAIGLMDEQKKAAKPRRQRTALVRVIPEGETFSVHCGWCDWTSGSNRLTFHTAQLQAHNHNRHTHRDHCAVDARVA